MVPDSQASVAASGTSTAGITRVLVADDSRLQRKILVASLKRWGFEVVEAETGRDALDKCRDVLPDLVLSDWMMPEMDGLEFCTAFRDLCGDQHYGYFILLTSKAEKEEIARGLESGADDFLSKPFDASELRARIRAGDRLVAMHKQLSEQNAVVQDTLTELKSVYDALDRDIANARKIQEALVPSRTGDFGKGRVSLLLKPCGHIGGDLVGMFSPGHGMVGFYGVDVSGHGITSAMMTARVGGYLSPTHPEQNIAMVRRMDRFFALLPPGEVAEMLNDRFTMDTGVEEYFTMAYAVVDQSNGRMRAIQAGHPYPMVIRADGSHEFVGDGGVPLGLMPNVEFAEFEVNLSPGDKVLFYSDGFSEATMRNGEMLEQEGMSRLLAKCDLSASGVEILDDLYWYLNQCLDPEIGIDDDVSAALYEFNG
ncbi:PP2C family protein-serine/threonine phosphatase [Pseudaestuariivita atlantica]|uniref:Chemotaxis protein CheY n=1 Tax=Pseudaestuariivita atlantica TaxID=1317121 RepID=A0A0L1JQ80_9RHOB|nr:SpoIIE family protein phosphatase [Pseudaestuariivita atlantica]KNG93905.1 chemotaxis protein CheY [Pseudaestuariivita atlantica]